MIGYTTYHYALDSILVHKLRNLLALCAFLVKITYWLLHILSIAKYLFFLADLG